jgi:hypothetical protein
MEEDFKRMLTLIKEIENAGVNQKPDDEPPAPKQLSLF